MIPLLVNDPSKLPAGFDEPAGMILMGAFLVRDFKTEAVPEVGPGQYSFPTCPVLTIGGEMDGLCRITRVAEAYHTQIDMSTDAVSARQTLPVTVIEGMSHMQFSSGDIPKFVELRDLVPEISYDEAHTRVASDVASFTMGVLDGSWDGLNKRMDESLSLIAPIVTALQQEGYHQFFPPCYCEATDEYGGLEYGTCPEQPGCQANAPWTQRAQQIMAGQQVDGTGVQIIAHDSQHIVTEEHPSCHLPHVHDGTDRDTDTLTANTEPSANPGHDEQPPLCSTATDCTLNITTVTQLWYQTGSELDIWRFTSLGSDTIDTGYFPISAREMKSKMKSRHAILQAAGDPIAGTDDTTMEGLDGLDAGRCGEINAAAIDYALSLLPAATRERYEQKGQPMKVDPIDAYVCPAGPCWIWSSLDFSDRYDADYVSVKAPSFAEANSNPFPCGEENVEGKLLPCPAGMHYCKLLSPARAIEWMYVDSNRKNNSLRAQQKEGRMSNKGRVSNSTTTDTEDAKCCSNCDIDGGYAKYYSIAKIQDTCGECCMLPEDFKKYKLFEPGLKLADSNEPCLDRNYSTYKGTYTHGENSPLDPMVLDIYDHDV